MAPKLPDIEKIRQALPQYKILEVAGHGGMSIVYLVEHTVLGQKRALKVISPELAEDEKFRRRFIRESRILVSLDHPNIVSVYDAGQAGGFLYLVMRYVKGPDLHKLLQQDGPLPLKRTADIVRQVAQALDVAHADGLIHRDVKPANVLIAYGKEGADHCYLSDFGLAKTALSTASLTGTGLFIGTPAYASPEQIEGKKLDGRSDIYSLGCLIYECLAGVPPFVKDSDLATMWAHMRDTPSSVRQKRPELPAGIDRLLEMAMAKSPAERFKTCMALSDRLDALLPQPDKVRAGTVAAPRELPPTKPAPVIEERTKEPEPKPAPAFSELKTSGPAPPPRLPRKQGASDRSPISRMTIPIAVVAAIALVAALWMRGNQPEAPPDTPKTFDGDVTASNPPPSCSASSLTTATSKFGQAIASAPESFHLAQAKPVVVLATFGDKSNDRVTSSQEGMDLAIGQANSAGDLPVTLGFDAIDNPGGKGETAVPIAQQLIEDPSVVAVLGGAFSPEVASTGGQLSNAGLLNFTPIATRSSLSLSGFKTFFRGVLSDGVQGTAAITTLDFLGCKKIAIVNDARAYSQGLAEGALTQARVKSIEVALEKAVEPSSDYSSLVDEIISKSPEAVFYAGYSAEFASLVRQLKAQGFAGLLISGDGSRNSELVKRLGAQAAEGVLLTSTIPDINQSRSAQARGFVGEYREAFGRAPREFAAEGYDVANVTIEAIRTCAEDGAEAITRECVVDKVRNTTHQGITKKFEFTPNGEVKAGDVVLSVVRSGKISDIGPVGGLGT